MVGLFGSDGHTAQMVGLLGGDGHTAQMAGLFGGDRHTAQMVGLLGGDGHTAQMVAAQRRWTYSTDGSSTKCTNTVDSIQPERRWHERRNRTWQINMKITSESVAIGLFRTKTTGGLFGMNRTVGFRNGDFLHQLLKEDPTL